MTLAKGQGVQGTNALRVQLVPSKTGWFYWNFNLENK
jgi:hypothetical protein